MSCKKGGFVTIRHNDLRDLTAKTLSEVCNDTELNENCPVKYRSNRNANRSNEARLNIQVRSF